MSYYAKVVGNQITHVEVVTDEFFNANPKRYSGKWIKVGEGSNLPYCGKDQGYLEGKDKILPRKPFPSWHLDNQTDEWKAPKPKPQTDEDWYWDEEKQDWFKAVKPFKQNGKQ